MKFNFKLLTAAVFTLGLGLSSVFAQQIILTPTQMSTQCVTSPNQCSALVAAQIKALKTQGLTPAALDTQLTAIVVAMTSEQNIPSNVSTKVMRELSVEVSDPSIAQQISLIADTVEIGNSIETAALGELASAN